VCAVLKPYFTFTCCQQKGLKRSGVRLRNVPVSAFVSGICWENLKDLNKALPTFEHMCTSSYSPLEQVRSFVGSYL